MEISSGLGDRCFLTAFPLEIFNNIVLELTHLQPLGPPSIVIPLMQTCRTIYELLLSDNNPNLYGSVYRHKFDTAAVTRRAFCLTPSQCTIQLQQAFAAMRIIRSGDVYTGEVEANEWDMGLVDALRILFVMMLDDEGRNARQILLWAHADVFVKKLIMHRLYEGSEDNDGWPLDDSVNAYGLWLMWLLTSEESLFNETPEERLRIQNLLVAFVYPPVRYTVAFAPPNHFLIPLTDRPEVDTLHGPYPVYYDGSVLNTVYFDARCIFACPPAAVAARLLFMARFEVNPIPTAKHLYRTRAELEEFNWGWTTHPPMGTGLHTRSGARKMVDGWGGREWEMEEDEDEDEEKSYPQRPPDNGSIPGVEPPAPIPKWVGRAPHSMTTGEDVSKSRKWDMDWYRMRFCGHPGRAAPRIPYANIFEPGTLDGLWQGSMMLPGIEFLRELIDNPRHDHANLVENTRQSDSKRLFVRLRELHGVEGEVFPFAGDGDANMTATGMPFGLGSADEHYGMMNGWFSGQSRPLILPQEDDKVLVQVDDEMATYRSRRGLGSQRLGNDAYSSLELAAGEGHGIQRPVLRDPEEVQYEHDSATCSKCIDRKKFRDLLDTVTSYKADEDFDNFEDEEGLLTAWDPEDNFLTRSYLGEDGRPLAPLPMAHEWDRRGRGQCDGIRDIIVVGEPDPDHAAAFGDFFFYGRVRRWDGMLLLIRVPKQEPDLGIMVFYGNVVGGDTIVGKWRWGGTDAGQPDLEGTFSLGRRLD
ncbi:hypothetical protein DXG01_015586 [Tephrocybe rancida]|nr:hypothetical protein DXG01_015586 [Tephrocybe rancida]